MKTKTHKRNFLIIAATVSYLIPFVLNKARADFKTTDNQEIRKAFCKNIKEQTTKLMNTYNSNEEEVSRGGEEARNEGVRIRSIGLTNLNFMANIWVAFCKKH